MTKVTLIKDFIVDGEVEVQKGHTVTLEDLSEQRYWRELDVFEHPELFKIEVLEE